jgi:N-acetylglucosaminyl-diphospho-decaprenol L-rhamnosyltransferase
MTEAKVEQVRNPPIAAKIDAVLATARGDLAMNCLHSLVANQLPPDRIWIVDNGSADDVAGQVSGRAGANAVRTEAPVGLSHALNLGARQGTGEFVLFLNDDVIAPEGAVSRLAAALRADGTAVAAGGRLIDASDLATQPEYKPRRFPTLLAMTLVVTGLTNVWESNPVSRRYMGADLDDEATVPVDQPAAACLLVRREDFEGIGGFDEAYWYWYEDVDLARRLSDRGRILYVPAAAFRHVGAASLGELDPATTVRSRYTGILRYAEQHFSRGAQIGLGAAVIASGILRALWFALTRPESARAWMATVRGGGRLLLGHSPGSLR